jgi:hypothetical protein
VKLKDARDAYYTHSGKASDVSRQLALAGIALVWVFKIGSGPLALPAELVRPAFAFVLTLLLDVLQYAFAALIWGAFARQRERSSTNPDADFDAPAQLNWPALLCFWAKLASITIGYGLMSQYVLDVLKAVPRPG